MGVSAISSMGDAYAQNRREVPAYQAAVAERGIATMRGYRLSEDDRLRRAVIGRLLCHTVIPKARDRARVRDFVRRVFRGEIAAAEGAVGRRTGDSRSRRNSRDAARAHLHSQRGDGLRPLHRGTEDGSEASVLEDAVSARCTIHESHKSRSSAEEFPGLRALTGFCSWASGDAAGSRGAPRRPDRARSSRTDFFSKQGRRVSRARIRFSIWCAKWDSKASCARPTRKAPRYVLRHGRLDRNSDVAAGDACELPCWE